MNISFESGLFLATIETPHPYVLEADAVGFELQRGFAYPLLIGMDVIGRCDLGVLHDGNAQLVLP